MSSPSNKPSPKPSGTDSVSKKQSFQEWAAAGGGVPLEYKGREKAWANQVKKYAAGGEAKMQAGGISRLLKGLKGTQEVLPAAQREANLQRMLEDSAIKDRLYHGTGADISEFKPSVIGAMGPGTYLTKNPKEASEYANVISHKRATNQPNVLPVHAQVKNPLKISRVNRSGSELFNRFDPSGKLTDDEVIELVKKAGYDAIHALEEGTINVLDPRKIKSAIGNRGTYDTTNPDLNKAAGGAINMDKGGAAFGVFPQMKPRRAKQDREAAKNVPVDLARGFVSGVLGAPGDIESLARLPYELITGNESPTFLPTSEDIEKRLPFRSEAPVSRAASGAGQLAGGFYMGPGSPLRVVGALPGAIKHGAKEFAKASAAAAPRLTVYHGSPHKFPSTAKNPLGEFDASKMGTGEGAQTYGHGHYLAESPDVGKGYQERLSGSMVTFQKQPESDAEKWVRDRILERASVMEEGHKQLEADAAWDRIANPLIDFIKGNKYMGIPAMDAEGIARMEAAKNLGKPTIAPTGSLYTVDLPDEMIAKMLDWDKPLSEQYSIAERMKNALTGPGSPLSPVRRFEAKDWLSDPVRMRNLHPQSFADLKDPTIVEQLRQAGIPGVRYLDQDSRTAGKGTSNFVVFPGEEDALTILDRKKEGGAVHMAEGGAAFGIYPKQRATPSSEETKKAVKQASEVGVDLLLPQDAVDVGMMLVPGGKIARKAGAALIAGGASTDTEAGVMKEVLKNLLKPGAKAATQEVTAAERAAAGRKAAELIKSQPQVKASEALGQAMEKGFKKTTTTQADRTRVGGGNIGGAPFSAISEVDPAYAGKVWGVMDEGTAARLKNLTDPETAWTTMLGSANQLKTNPIVFDKLKKGFLESMKAGNLKPELEAKINHNLALTFGEGARIRDPKIWKEADTFEKRAVLADLMMGQSIAPGKGGVALGGEKSGKGVIFKPTDILKRETEPGLLHPEHGGNAPTFAAGPRLFSMDPVSEFRPDLHPGFPTLISGKDLGYNMIPTPTEVYLPDWHSRFKKANPDRKGPGYYDLALGVKGEGLPSQDLNDLYIRHLIREGFKAGGAVSGLSTVNKLCGCHD